MKRFPHFKQLNIMDCGPTCIRIVSKFYGRTINPQKIRELAGSTKEGVSLLGLSQAAEKIGFHTNGIKVGLRDLNGLQLPMILHWSQSHFVVLYRIKNGKYYVSDPSRGLIDFSIHEFSQFWLASGSDTVDRGLALLLNPLPEFYQEESEKSEKIGFGYIFNYLRNYRQLILQLIVGLGIGSLLQMIVPFLTQSLVDVGINSRNLSFIYIILIAQTMLMLGRTGVEFLRSWILLHISTRVNISILTDFIIKLMKLPMSYFDEKMTGDIMQRMQDQGRIQNFLTGPTLNIIFSMFNLVIFAVVMAIYSINIFLIFLLSSVLYTLWVVFFLKKRRSLDFKRFHLSAKNQNAVMQLVTGMQEIKLNNFEQQKRWEWERIQAGLFRFSVKSLSLGQIQQGGTTLINETKNIIITFIVAKSVVDGQLTLGGMMAIQYVLGQLNSPIEQILGFIQQLQDAKISLERLNDIHTMDDEEPIDKTFLNELPTDKALQLKNLSFKYPGSGNRNTLSEINLAIPFGKTTAIVGMSGSGKTTILKLLLRYYEPQVGEIYVGNIGLSHISHRFWRSNCGTVMQEGFIFSDTILRNIIVGDENPNFHRLQEAIRIANLDDFVRDLPLGVHTKVGTEGNGISQGQRQRILIARVVYKNPDFVFFDEATNSLDSRNESIIMENLRDFFKGKTVVVVAHRLSTVRNADNIVVLENGKITEQGTHSELTKIKGEYFSLVKNQLELGS